MTPTSRLTRMWHVLRADTAQTDARTAALIYAASASLLGVLWAVLFAPWLGLLVALASFAMGMASRAMRRRLAS